MIGWGKLVFFDTEEHQIPDGLVQLAAFPQLASQWKIVHDFKPTKFLGLGWSLWVHLEGTSFRFLALRFLDVIPKMALVNEDSTPLVKGRDQLPPVGEWTRIEIGHEAGENGTYFLFVTVGGQMLGRVQVPSPRNGRGFPNVRIGIGHGKSQPGLIRRLVVLERH